MDVSSDQCVVESDDAAATRPVETSGQAAGADPGQADSAPVQSHLVSQPLEEMAQSLATVTALVTDTQRHARSREAVIDKLHQENQELRAGSMQRLLQPILRDLIRLHDDLVLTAESLRTTTEYAARPLASELDGFRDSVLDILYRQSCEPFDVAAGDCFDAAAHQPITVRATDERDKDGRIAEVLRIGFTHHGAVLRPAQTAVWRYSERAQQGSGGPQ